MVHGKNQLGDERIILKTDVRDIGLEDMYYSV
jgi:hypothetical protein